MNVLVYVIALGAGVWFLVDLYIFEFDSYTEKELVRLSFCWAPLLLFGILGLAGWRAEKVSNHLLAAVVGTLLCTAVMAGILMLVFLS